MKIGRQLKIVFAGPMGAGKTTAIHAISDVPPILNEVVNNDRATHDKAFTTVGQDFGQLHLEDGTCIRLYGTPGQKRFAFMWPILCQGALGVILLIDGASPTALKDFVSYLELFRAIATDQPFVIGVGRVEPHDESALSPYVDVLGANGLDAPVFGVDVRQRADVVHLVETLFCILQSRLEPR